MHTSNLRCLQHRHIQLMLFTVWIHQTYMYYNMDPSILCYLQYGPITLMLFTLWTHQTYVYYSIKLDLPNVCCLDHVHIKLTLFTVCTIKPTLLNALTNRHYVAYSMKSLSLRCLYNGSIIIQYLQYELITFTLLTQ